jgi:hypothetical protein
VRVRTAAGTHGVRDVQHLVALGANPSTAADTPNGAARKTKQAPRSGPPKWLAPAIVGASVITAAVTAYLQYRFDEEARFDVWVTSEGAGLGIQGRF